LNAVLVGVHQPAYLLWFGLLEKIALCDRFVVLDTVQYNARSFQHRTLYSSDTGVRYLSLAVHSKGHQVRGTTIGEITLADATVPATHFQTLRHRYGKRPGWPIVAGDLESILCRTHERLLDLDVALMEVTLRHFGIDTELVLASGLDGAGTKGALMLSLVRAAGGHAYLSGAGARDYMEEDAFAAAGVGLFWQAFDHPVYPQSHDGRFQPGCFALEWIIEEPDTAAHKFREHIASAARRVGLDA
jgi:hypothetical protein